MGKPKRQVSRFHRPALRAKSGFFDEEKFWKNEKTKTAEIQLTSNNINTSTHQHINTHHSSLTPPHHFAFITHHTSLITHHQLRLTLTHSLTHTQHTHTAHTLYALDIQPRSGLQFDSQNRVILLVHWAISYSLHNLAPTSRTHTLTHSLTPPVTRNGIQGR